jgi:hypothetical protein
VVWEPPNGRRRFAINGANLTDEDCIIGVFAIPGLRIVGGYNGPPRTYSPTVRLNLWLFWTRAGAAAAAAPAVRFVPSFGGTPGL